MSLLKESPHYGQQQDHAWEKRYDPEAIMRRSRMRPTDAERAEQNELVSKGHYLAERANYLLDEYGELIPYESASKREKMAAGFSYFIAPKSEKRNLSMAEFNGRIQLQREMQLNPDEDPRIITISRRVAKPHDGKTIQIEIADHEELLVTSERGRSLPTIHSIDEAKMRPATYEDVGEYMTILGRMVEELHPQDHLANPQPIF